ncbi:protein NO VEIN domain-containing protein [Rhizobium laguerreae]
MLYSLKRLTASDLTFFEDKFRESNVGNQKAINLNRKVFIDLLYPSARAIAAGRALQFPCELRIFGPNAIDTANVVMRKIIAAGGSQKNWRLNGETVHAPSDLPDRDRYRALQVGDLVALGFGGGEVPTEAVLVLVSKTAPMDSTVFAALDRLIGSSRMIALEESELSTIVSSSAATHPIRELLDPEMDEALAEAALGSAIAVEKLRARGLRRTTHKALAEAKANAERIGRDGEALVNGHFKGLLQSGVLREFRWEAESNATHPFDFTIDRASSGLTAVEVKSTEGPHERTMMFSHAEIHFAANAPNLEVWRVSRMAEGQAEVRVSTNMRGLATKLLEASNLMPGATPTGWTITIDALAPWSEVFAINFEDDPDE